MFLCADLFVCWCFVLLSTLCDAMFAFGCLWCDYNVVLLFFVPLLLCCCFVWVELFAFLILCCLLLLAVVFFVDRVSLVVAFSRKSVCGLLFVGFKVYLLLWLNLLVVVCLLFFVGLFAVLCLKCLLFSWNVCVLLLVVLCC